MFDIEALAAPAFLIEVSVDGTSDGPRLNAAGRAHPELVRSLAGSPWETWNAEALGGLGDRPGGTVTGVMLSGSGCRAGAPWRAVLSPLVGRCGRLDGILGICREERCPAHTPDHLSLALQAIHGAEWRYDVLRDVYEASDEIATLTGEALPRTVTWAEWLERVHPQDLLPFLERPEPQGTSEFRFHAVGGELRWGRCSRISVKDEAGAIEAVLGIMVDITPERVRETAWAELATHDPLTGLLNRRGLRQEIDRLQVESGENACLALFTVDLDRFKETNDAHGHVAGDAVLVEASRRLATAAEGAVCARLGGDEFVAVLPVSDEAEVEERRVRVERAFRRPLGFRGCWLPVSASVGSARSSGAVDVGRLMDEADADLYARKRTSGSARADAA